jgi:tetratricopeptide (TPR) repeat protein
MGACISTDRILSRLDEYLHKNDYISAERHLLYWLDESTAAKDLRTELLVRNELMGLYRKTAKKEQALECVNAALQTIKVAQISHQVGAATTFLNCATVYKAFGMAERGIELFYRAKEIYERELEPSDGRLGGLYNNMALALVDLGRFSEAMELYGKAIDIMNRTDNGKLEVAITYLNIASAMEGELGLVDADEQIQSYLAKARDILEAHVDRNGYYAFVCEKCASVFGYYGWFVYENELNDRARRIYEGN